MKILCYLRTIKYTFLRFVETGKVVPYISGHEFIEQKSYIKGKKKYFPLKCSVCGTISTAWIRIK